MWLCEKKCKKSVFLSLYKFCYNSVHFCICQNLINSSVEIIKIIMSTELFAQISSVNRVEVWAFWEWEEDAEFPWGSAARRCAGCATAAATNAWRGVSPDRTRAPAAAPPAARFQVSERRPSDAGAQARVRRGGRRRHRRPRAPRPRALRVIPLSQS